MREALRWDIYKRRELQSEFLDESPCQGQRNCPLLQTKTLEIEVGERYNDVRITSRDSRCYNDVAIRDNTSKLRLQWGRPARDPGDDFDFPAVAWWDKLTSQNSCQLGTGQRQDKVGSWKTKASSAKSFGWLIVTVLRMSRTSSKPKVSEEHPTAANCTIFGKTLVRIQSRRRHRLLVLGSFRSLEFVGNGIETSHFARVKQWFRHVQALIPRTNFARDQKECWRWAWLFQFWRNLWILHSCEHEESVKKTVFIIVSGLPLASFIDLYFHQVFNRGNWDLAISNTFEP